MCWVGGGTNICGKWMHYSSKSKSSLNSLTGSGSHWNYSRRIVFASFVLRFSFFFLFSTFKLTIIVLREREREKSHWSWSIPDLDWIDALSSCTAGEQVARHIPRKHNTRKTWPNLASIECNWVVKMLQLQTFSLSSFKNNLWPLTNEHPASLALWQRLKLKAVCECCVIFCWMRMQTWTF